MKRFTTAICVLFLGSVSVFAGELPFQDNTTNYGLSFRNFNVNIHAENYSAETREYMDWETGEIFTYEVPERTYGTLWVYVEQGGEFGNVIPVSNSFQVWPKWDGGLSVETEFNYVFFDGEMEDWVESPRGGLNISFGDVNFDSVIRTEHQEEWIWGDKEEGGPTVIETIDIISSFDFNMDEALISNASIRINDFLVHDKDQMWEGVTVGSRFDVEWLGDPDDFAMFFGTLDNPISHGGGGGGGSVSEIVMMATPVPEPGTAALLLMGVVSAGCLCSRWRK